MSWASGYIERLKNGETVKFRPKGNSMSGKIESGQLCTVEPVVDLSVNDIVLCKVKGNHYLHIIRSISEQRYLIGNNRGGINGWISKNSIFGKLVKIEN